jgi:hypothetical protein
VLDRNGYLNLRTTPPPGFLLHATRSDWDLLLESYTCDYGEASRLLYVLGKGPAAIKPRQWMASAIGCARARRLQPTAYACMYDVGCRARCRLCPPSVHLTPALPLAFVPRRP